MARALGVDFGEARIGLAASDELGMMAHPVETIHRRETPDYLARIAEVVAERNIETVVVGLPLRLDGTHGTAAEKVNAFVTDLRAKLPESVEIEAFDERLSTVEAQRQLHEAGRSTRTSRDVIDQAAAVVILQDYLDEKAGPAPPPEPEEDEV